MTRKGSCSPERNKLRRNDAKIYPNRRGNEQPNHPGTDSAGDRQFSVEEVSVPNSGCSKSPSRNRFSGTSGQKTKPRRLTTWQRPSSPTCRTDSRGSLWALSTKSDCNRDERDRVDRLSGPLRWEVLAESNAFRGQGKGVGSRSYA